MLLTSVDRGIIKWWFLSVCPSIIGLSVACLSRTEKSRKLKIGRMEAHHTGNS